MHQLGYAKSLIAKQDLEKANAAVMTMPKSRHSRMGQDGEEMSNHF